MSRLAELAESWDVLVVGAGPAGMAAATVTAQAGALVWGVEGKAISDFIDDVLAISRRLAKINKDDNELPKVAALSPYGDRYKAQIAINRIVQRRLLELHGELRKRLPPDAATGSRATKTQ